MIFKRAAPSETACRFKNALLIRTAMKQRRDGLLNAAGMRWVLAMRESRDPAQL